MRLDRDPVRTAAREAPQQRRVGKDAACAWCGENRHPALLEKHHPAGRANDPGCTYVLCRNCHAIASDDQLREAVELGPQTDPRRRHVARMRANATALRSAATAEDRAADHLEALIELDDSKEIQGKEKNHGE